MGGFDSPRRPDSGTEDERLSTRLLETGVLTPEQLALCLAERDRHRSVGRPTRLAEILLAGGYVGSPRLSEILSDAGIEPFGPAGLPPEAAAQADTERFGKFTRVQLLGDGGMGQVWKAWDSSLGRWVALKFLKGRDRSDVARLLREAQTAGRLSHPNIVAVHEVGMERGEHYIAMQYIDGQTLETHPRTDRKGLVRLIRDAARAVALAHREGIVHRDLKPSNLIVAERPGSPPHVYVADFGLARSISDPAHLSRTGMILGTPDYMSPEQAKGEAVDERTDVWALGATLYELTTDRPPFASSNLVNLLKRIADEDPKRPRRIQSKIAPDLETIILKCLEKDPARRYATADALADDLDRYLGREPIQARPPSFLYRLRKQLAKRKALVTLGSAALAVIAFLGFTLWFQERPEREHLRLYRAGMKAWEELLRSSFGSTDRAWMTERARATRKLFELANEWTERPDAHVMIGRCLELEGEDSQALDSFERACALDETHEEARLILARWLLVAYQSERGEPPVWLLEDGNKDLASVWPEGESGELRKRAQGLLARGPVRADRLDLLTGLILMGEGKLERAQDALLRHLGRDPLDTKAMALVATCFRYQENYKSAVDMLTRMLNLTPESQIYLERGDLKGRLGELNGALQDCDEGVRLGPDNVNAYTYRASARHALKDHDGEMKDYTRAIELRPRWGHLRVRRSRVFWEQGDREAAFRDLEQAFKDPEHEHEARETRARFLNELGDTEGALKDYARANEIYDNCALCHYHQGRIRVELGRCEEAIRNLDKSIEQNRQFPPAFFERGRARRLLKQYDLAIKDLVAAKEPEFDTGPIWFNLSAAYAAVGRKQEALDGLERAADLGFKDLRPLEEDPDLADIRSEERYRKLVDRLKSK